MYLETHEDALTASNSAKTTSSLEADFALINDDIYYPKASSPHRDLIASQDSVRRRCSVFRAPDVVSPLYLVNAQTNVILVYYKRLSHSYSKLHSHIAVPVKQT